MTKKLQTSILSAFSMLLLILDTKTALYGAQEALNLCVQTVIPSLLPFFVFSSLLCASLMGEKIPIVRWLSNICGIPKGSESLLLVSILGGYPAGAQCITQAYRDGALCRTDAQRMLAFSNLAGPAFIFGIVAAKFNHIYTAWILWAIHIVSALLVSAILPHKSENSAVIPKGTSITLSDALHRSLRVMASVCGWIILFRIIIAFLQRWVLWLFPPTVQVIIIGLLELSNGCWDLAIISNEALRFIISAGMLSFGGLCVFMQTSSVTNGLSLKTYCYGKLLQTFLSIIIACALLHLPVWGLIISAVIIICGIFLHKKQKNSSISRLVGV